MNRITPEMVVNAYRNTGLTPLQGDWCTQMDGGRKCGCALTALYANDIPEILEKDGTDWVVFEEEIFEHFGEDYMYRYLDGFYLGFDVCKMAGMRTEEEEEFSQGYADGLEARKAVIKEFGKFNEDGLILHDQETEETEL